MPFRFMGKIPGMCLLIKILPKILERVHHQLSILNWTKWELVGLQIIPSLVLSSLPNLSYQSQLVVDMVD